MNPRPTQPFDTGSPAGRMMVQMLGVFAEFEPATLQIRALKDASRHLIGVATRPLPAVLAPDVGAQPHILCLQRVRLVLLVGRDAGVSRDSQFDFLPVAAPRFLGIRSVA